MNNKYLYITLMTMLGTHAEAAAHQAQLRSAPRLVVNVAIDQLRSDYLEAFAPLYTEDGFKKLLGEGAVYRNASHAFSPVDRASAVAAIVTGITPYYNSIVGCRWLNRSTLRPTGCVDDDSAPGILTSETASPSVISTSTIADELKVATQGEAIVYSVAPFKDAAVLAAGHAADGALWIDDTYGNWCSSQYYFKAVPSWMQVFNGLHSPNQKIVDTVWEPAPTATDLTYFMSSGRQRPFRHKFSGDHKFARYKASALVNADVTDMARQCITYTGMGTNDVTDMISLTYYAGTFDHQSVTKCQHELQDTYVRLDMELGRLISFLSQHVGLDNVLLVVTSTGYDEEEPADYQKYRIPSGTFYMSRTANLLNMYLGAIWGQGQYVEAAYGNQIFLNHKLLETKRISMGEATGRAQELLAMMQGVRNVYTSLQLLTVQSEQLTRIRNGYNPERCGDLLIETAPGWRLINEDTQENIYTDATFTPFPIIVFGAGIESAQTDVPVSTDRIAPTIARAIRIRAPNACTAEPLPLNGM